MKYIPIVLGIVLISYISPWFIVLKLVEGGNRRKGGEKEERREGKKKKEEREHKGAGVDPAVVTSLGLSSALTSADEGLYCLEPPGVS